MEINKIEGLEFNKLGLDIESIDQVVNYIDASHITSASTEFQSEVIQCDRIINVKVTSKVTSHEDCDNFPKYIVAPIPETRRITKVVVTYLQGEIEKTKTFIYTDGSSPFQLKIGNKDPEDTSI